MKSTLLCFLSILLATSNLAPLGIAILSHDIKTSVVIDFNEEENKKEEKKEINGQDLFSHLQFIEITAVFLGKSAVPTFYIEGVYSYSSDIFLPPPERSFYNVG